MSTIARSVVNTLETELRALAELTEAVKADYQPLEYAVEVIEASVGRVIVTGVGKSGIVAQKAASTLRSLGTAAFYLDPNAMAHGDLGGVRKGDVIIAYSVSGETEELAPIFARVEKDDETRLIGVGCDVTSRLGKASNVFVQLPKMREACRMGLAPTSTTTMMIAISDAIAIALGERMGYDKLDFIGNHPAGALGAR